MLTCHSLVITAEQYSNMNLKRVAQDFPELSNLHNNQIKLGKGDMVLGDSFEYTPLLIDDRNMN